MKSSEKQNQIEGMSSRQIAPESAFSSWSQAKSLCSLSDGRRKAARHSDNRSRDQIIRIHLHPYAVIDEVRFGPSGRRFKPLRHTRRVNQRRLDR